jgi:hypothetical protein
MDIKFADSFGKSIKRLIRHNTWWYKAYELFRYDLPLFFKNVWTFRKALWNHHWFDHHGTLMFLETGLTHISDTVEKYGNEIDGPRLKKVVAMRRVIELIKNYNEDKYIDMAETELGELVLHDLEFESVPDKPEYSQLVDKNTPEEKEHNRKVFDRAREIEEQEWDELFKILKGQDHKEYRKLYEAQTEEEKIKRDLWYEWFDGSGLLNWWD